MAWRLRALALRRLELDVDGPEVFLGAHPRPLAIAPRSTDFRRMARSEQRQTPGRGAEGTHRGPAHGMRDAIRVVAQSQRLRAELERWRERRRADADQREIDRESRQTERALLRASAEPFRRRLAPADDAPVPRPATRPCPGSRCGSHQ
jgi:hypothetical protein